MDCICRAKPLNASRLASPGCRQASTLAEMCTCRSSSQLYPRCVFVHKLLLCRVSSRLYEANPVQKVVAACGSFQKPLWQRQVLASLPVLCDWLVKQGKLCTDMPHSAFAYQNKTALPACRGWGNHDAFFRSTFWQKPWRVLPSRTASAC